MSLASTTGSQPFQASQNLVSLPSDATEADFVALTTRMRAEYAGQSSRLASMAIATLASDGSWPDIDYADRSAGEWKPMAHLDRIRAMAVAFASATDPYGGAAPVREAVVRALRAWVARGPQSDNWWHNTIGVQLTLTPTLLLMGDTLPADLRSSLLSTYARLPSIPADRKTGQNLVWYAMQHVVRGALTRNSADVATGRDAIRSTLDITTSEGLQNDLSFHQHGNQLYSGGYGLALLSDTVRMASWLQGTAWRFPAQDTNLLADYATLGIGPLVRGDWLDWSARGREITRQEATPRTAVLRTAIQSLVHLVPDRRPALEALQLRLDKTPPTVTTTQGFWRSDFLSHQTPNGYFSVKMVSRRTVGTESGNGENLLGYWLPFGTTFIVGKGDGHEYLGLQPLFDWSALPGTTAPQLIPSFTGYLRHAEDQVAVLSSPSNGVASMQVNTQGLKAKKFWFFDGEMMVALGTDIRYTGTARVRTTVNQTRWMGGAQSDVAALTSGVGNAEQSNVKWLTHGGVGYLLMDDQSGALQVDERRLKGTDPTTRAYGAVAAKAVPAQLMTLSIDHGTNPQGAGYAYAVVHGIDSAAQLQSMAKPRVLVNTPLVQGAASADGRAVAVVFHQPGQVDLGRGLSLQSDQAVAVLGQRSGLQLQIQVISLSGKASTVTLRTSKDGTLLGQQTVSIPSNLQRTRDTPAASVALPVPL